MATTVAEQLKTMTPAQQEEERQRQEDARERRKRRSKRNIDAEERRKVEPPEILTLRERLARPRLVVNWRIAQFQAVGHRVLLAAQFKAGKTTMVANVARSLLDGEMFLDTFDVAAITGTVCLLDFEMSPNQLDDWYRDVEISNDDRMVVIPMRGAASSFNILDADARDHWAKLLKSLHVQYLILDCLRPVLDALALNEHTEAGLFLTAFDALLREANIPETLVIQHMGHKNERARGDSRLLDWPDVGWTLVRESEEDPSSARFIRAFGRDVDVPETQLVFCTSTRRLAVEGGGSRADAKVAAALADICAFVGQAAEAPSGRQIEEAVKLNEHTQSNIRKAIREGIETRVLVKGTGRTGGASYTLGSGLDASNPLEKSASAFDADSDEEHGM